MLKEHVALGTEPVGVVVHIGAGFCRTLDDYLAAGFESIQLVEPNTDVLSELAAKVTGFENVTVIAAAVAPANGRSALQVLNFADLSSLRHPQSLSDLLPGIQLVEERQVDTLTLETLLGQLAGLSETKENWLVVEAPGEELAIANALLSSEYSRYFQNILVQCGRESYFEGDSSAVTVLSALRKAGYQLVESYTDVDPDWPHYFLRLDQVQLENTSLKADLHTAENNIIVLDEQLAAVQAEGQEARTALEQQLAERTQVLQEVQGQLAAVQAEGAAAAVVAKEDYQDRLLGIEETQKRDLGVALRLQALARSDQQELQMRYGALLDEKAQQDDLLIKVTQQLGSAAQHLQQLAHQEALQDDVPAAKPVSTRKPVRRTATKTAKKSRPK